MWNPINSLLLWDAPKIQKVKMDWKFTFNWWALDNWINVRVKSCDYDDLWTMDFETYKTPLQDWGWVLWKYYRKKTITFVLSIIAWTKYAFNELIDELKFQTSKTEWILRIEINWLIRERTATCTSLKFNRQSYNIDWAWNVVLTFTCVNPHSQLETPNTEDIIIQTWEFQSSLLYDWKAETYPKLYILMDSGSSSWMRFSLNWYNIEINENLTQGDIIIFDWDTKEVSVNDVEVAYTWVFTPLIYWENIYTINNTWTYTWTLSYFTKFL